MPDNFANSSVVFQDYAGLFRSQRPPIIPSNVIQIFSFENTANAISTAKLVFGLPLIYGDFPEFVELYITREADSQEIRCQFDRRVTKNGYLVFVMGHAIDSDFTPLEERTYQLRARLGLFDNFGDKTVSDIQSACDLNIQISNNQRFNGSSNEADPIGASLSRNFNDLFSVPTRVNKIASGTACEGFRAWGMAQNASLVEHPHLKIEPVVKLWKDEIGTVIDVQFCSVIAQDWFDTPNKYRQDYDLVLRNGSTPIEIYNGVQHHYHSRFATIDKSSTLDSRYAKSFWLNDAPTLHYKPDREYWKLTGYVPPLDTTIPVATIKADQPGDIIWSPGSQLHHEEFVDSTGGAEGRGIITDLDAKSFISQDATEQREARINAHAGLHVPYCYTSQAQRTRPGESSDVANTIYSFVLTNPIDGVTDDFSPDGMPLPTHACRTSSDFPSGFVTPLGGNGPWTPSSSASHAVAYSYYQYLVEGEEYFYDATLFHATNLIHQANDSIYSTNPRLMYQADGFRNELNIPNQTWTGVAPLGVAQTRGVGWAANVLANAYAIASDDDLQTPCLRNWIEHSCEWMFQSEPYIPQSQKDAGIFYEYNTNERFIATSPWMLNFQAMGMTRLDNVVKHRGSKVAADILANWVRGFCSSEFYRLQAYYVQKLPVSDGWGSPNNEYLPDTELGFGDVNCTFDAATGTFTIVGFNENDVNFLTFANDDRFRLWDRTPSNASLPIDPAFASGQEFFLVEQSGNTFKAALTQGGSAITGSSNGTYRVFFTSVASADVLSGAATVQWNDDDRTPIAFLTATMVNQRDDTLFSDALLDTIKIRMGNWNPVQYFAWAAER